MEEKRKGEEMDQKPSKPIVLKIQKLIVKIPDKDADNIMEGPISYPGFPPSVWIVKGKQDK